MGVKKDLYHTFGAIEVEVGHPRLGHKGLHQLPKDGAIREENLVAAVVDVEHKGKTGLVRSCG